MATVRALKLIRFAKRGDPEAQVELAKCFLDGRDGLGRNLSAAYSWLSKAADRGNSTAVWLIGQHIPPSCVDDTAKAKIYYLEAKKQGCVPAATTVARWHLSGEFGPLSASEMAEQLNVLREAAAAGDVVAQLTLGSMATEGAAAIDDVKWLKAAAMAGDAEACKKLIEHFWKQAGGDLWQLGQSPDDEELRPETQGEAAREALLWHECYWTKFKHQMPATEMSRRCTLLLLNRHGSARKWLEKAAQAGQGGAAYVLGLSYMGAACISSLAKACFHRNYKYAEHWLRCASDTTLAEADFALWYLHSIRNYSLRDPVLARQYLNRAANMGHPAACWHKGGEALKAGDMLGAAHWWDRAALYGHQQAKLQLAALAPELSGPDAYLLAAAETMSGHDGEFALRLKLGAHFHLELHEYLLLNPRDAEAGEFLSVDVTQSCARGRKRLIRITSAAQREALRQAQIGLPPRAPLQAGEYKTLRRRFLYNCNKLNLKV